MYASENVSYIYYNPMSWKSGLKSTKTLIGKKLVFIFKYYLFFF